MPLHLFFLKIILAVWSPLWFHINFRIVFHTFAKKLAGKNSTTELPMPYSTKNWDFDMNFTEYVDHFAQYGNFNDIKSSNS